MAVSLQLTAWVQAELWCDGFRGVLQQTDSVGLFDTKKIWNVTSFNTLLCCQIRFMLNGCFIMRDYSSKLHPNTVFYPPKVPSHTGWQQECVAGNERPTVRTPLSLSFSLLTVQHCSASLHMPRQSGREPQQVWAHEKYYQPASQHLCTKAVFAQGTESLVLQKWKWTSCRCFETLKTQRRGHVSFYRSRTCDVLLTGLSFVSRSLCLPQTVVCRINTVGAVLMYNIAPPFFSQYLHQSIAIITIPQPVTYLTPSI